MPDARTHVAQHLNGIIQLRSKNEGESHHGGLSPPKPPTTGGRGGKGGEGGAAERNFTFMKISEHFSLKN